MGQFTFALLAITHSICDRLDGKKHFGETPMALYGVVLLMAATASTILKKWY